MLIMLLTKIFEMLNAALLRLSGLTRGAVYALAYQAPQVALSRTQVNNIILMVSMIFSRFALG